MGVPSKPNVSRSRRSMKRRYPASMNPVAKITNRGGRADAWFLDGFSPARNPELWEPALLAAVAARSTPGATAATYSAAGHVRRALAAAGFTVTRTAGYGEKRHMTRARL